MIGASGSPPLRAMRFASTLACRPPAPASLATLAQTVTRYAFVTTAGAALVMGCTVQLARVDGQSMAPTLANQDRLVVDQLTYRIGNPTPGDIVMFHVPVAPSRLFVKRIIAEDGDVVRIRDGRVIVNGRQLDDRTCRRTSAATRTGARTACRTTTTWCWAITATAAPTAVTGAPCRARRSSAGSRRAGGRSPARPLF